MLSEAFIRLIEGLFPSIDPFVAHRCTEALREHGTPDSDTIYSGVVYEPWSQGDVFSSITFPEVDFEAGRLGFLELPGILLSNTCDARHDDRVLFAPGYRIDLFNDQDASYRDALQRNTIFELVFLPDVPEYGALIFDLTQTTSLPRRAVAGRIQNGASRRVTSLTRFGWYLLIAKLTIFLLRPETGELEREAGL